jgi:sugar phosphate isomerase/epimerase
MDLTATNLAMSTSWNVRRHSQIGPVLAELRELGFSQIELNSLPPAMAAGLPDELARTGLIVQSLHDPIPWPVDSSGQRLGWSGLAELSAPIEEERQSAVAQAQGTIDLAARLGARAVILHLGHVDTSVPQPKLFALLRGGAQEEFLRLRDRGLAEREARRGPSLQSALRSVRELGEYAARAGISLGIEVRDGYHEIPSLDEFVLVFAACHGLPVYYWHDTGHAYRQEVLGIATAEAYLRRFGTRLLGAHLHDARPERDHLAPGLGNLDLAAIAARLPAGALRTLELNDAATAEQIRAGVELLCQAGPAGRCAL